MGRPCGQLQLEDAPRRGPTMHGGASLGVERLLRSIPTPASAASVLGEHLRRDERIPGIGHAVYTTEDPRATHLRRFSKEMGERNGETKWYDISRRVEDWRW